MFAIGYEHGLLFFLSLAGIWAMLCRRSSSDVVWAQLARGLRRRLGGLSRRFSDSENGRARGVLLLHAIRSVRRGRLRSLLRGLECPSPLRLARKPRGPHPAGVVFFSAVDASAQLSLLVAPADDGSVLQPLPGPHSRRNRATGLLGALFDRARRRFRGGPENRELGRRALGPPRPSHGRPSSSQRLRATSRASDAVADGGSPSPPTMRPMISIR